MLITVASICVELAQKLELTRSSTVAPRYLCLAVPERLVLLSLPRLGSPTTA